MLWSIELTHCWTFRGEHLSDEISDEFDSEGSNADDDEAVAPVAAKKNPPVDPKSNVSPLPITPIPIAPSVTNLPTCSVGPLRKVTRPPAGTPIMEKFGNPKSSN